MNSENLLFLDDAHFRLKISELFAPEGSENSDFQKIAEINVRWLYKHYLC